MHYSKKEALITGQLPHPIEGDSFAQLIEAKNTNFLKSKFKKNKLFTLNYFG